MSPGALPACATAAALEELDLAVAAGHLDVEDLLATAMQPNT